MRLGCLGFWLNCCLLAGCLGLWLNCCLLASCLGLWLGGFARLGSLARLTLKKFLRFLNSQELFFAQSQSRPIEALFTAQSGLTRELLTSKFHIDPRTSLWVLPRNGYVLLLSALVPATTSLLHKIFFDQSLHISHIQWIFLRLKS